MTEGVSAGASYLTKIRAMNVYGWSQLSSEFEIVASGITQTMDPVTTEYSPASHVKISWQAPYSNSGTITAYLIQI